MGLDHGSWSVLRHMYPKADVPAFQLSLDDRRSFKEHRELGREIQSLRERGVLILGSGNIVHNLSRMDWDNPSGAYDWAVEFDAKVKEAVEAHDANSLAQPQKWGVALLATARIRAANTTCHSRIAGAARTNATECRIRMTGLTSPASRCG